MTKPFRMILLLGVALASSASAKASEPIELFGGFSFANMKIDGTNSSRTYGWSTSVTAYPTRRVGFTADFSGFNATLTSYTNSSGGTTSFPELSVRQYSYLAGPQFRL